MPLVSSCRICCQLFFVFQNSLKNTRNLIHSLNLRYLIQGHNLTHIFAVDMFLYKITEPFQRSCFKSQLPKKPGNMPLSGFYLSFLDIKTTVSTCPVLGNISTQQHFSTLYPLSCRVIRSLASEVGLHEIYTILSTP